ncbi:unnamed protein product [Caenorhabditis angaria]|uniref:G-protein coupled receptors family 1 profile domain-containing protein n=1 Tax=Caenorhabditis angaria TaxID=860376 RepID=A0A9P1IPD3_9PELO|nr:unnamed protein product [Caenorhabditis angaria]
MFEVIKNWTQSICCYLALFFNILLIFLILLKSPKKMGTYKYLMIYFCVVSMVLSILDVVVKPYVVNIQSSFIIFMKNSETGFNNFTNKILLSCTSGCYAIILSSIAIHFIFRFFAIERKGKLKYFKGYFLIFWSLIPIATGILWVASISLLLAPTEHLKENIAPDIFRDYNVTSLGEITVLGSDWYYNFNGTRVMNYQTIQSAPIFVTIITCIPLFLLYIPVSFYLILPVFFENVEIFGLVSNLLYAIYPVLDPLPIIFIIDDYRLAVFDFLGIKRNNKVDVEEKERNDTSVET